MVNDLLEEALDLADAFVHVRRSKVDGFTPSLEPIPSPAAHEGIHAATLIVMANPQHRRSGTDLVRKAQQDCRTQTRVLRQSDYNDRFPTSS